MVILYKLYFLTSHFFSQSNKRVFHPSIFLPSQPNTYKRKLNLFYLSIFLSSLNFLFSYISIPLAKRTLKFIHNFVVVVAKVIKWAAVFIAKVRLVFVLPIDRSIYNIDVSCRFKYQPYQIHFSCIEEYIYIKFLPVNAYRPKLDKHFPSYFSYLDMKFVPHYQDLIPFSHLLLFLCLFYTFSNFQLYMCLLHCTVACSPSLSHYLFNVFFSFLLLFS